MTFGGVTVQRAVPTTMRDGITLYADLYLPKPEGRYPVLLMRQPYGRAIASTVTYAHPVWYASQGYLVIIQDVRGRGESEGDFSPFVNEANDGFDTIEWAASLPRSNGRIGMYGFSYQGSTQWAAASRGHPALVAIAPGMCAADLYRGMFYPHGRFALGDHLPWAFQLARDGALRAGDVEAAHECSQIMRDPSKQLWSMPLKSRHPILGRYFPAFYDWLEHESYDEYWRALDFLSEAVKCPIPALHIAGWYDPFLMGTLQSYEALQATSLSPGCFHRLVIGPWTHMPWGRKPGGIDHGPEAYGNHQLEHLRWFDHWLKEEGSKDLYREPAVRYFDLTRNEWREAQTLPPLFSARSSSSARWYLSGSSLPANGASGGGRLVKKVAEIAAAAPDVFVYDARLPMPLSSYLSTDRSAIQDRFEIVVYTSDAFEVDHPMFGSPRLLARVQTMGGPTDLVAILSVVDERGSARFLSVGRAEIGKSGEVVDTWAEVAIRLRPLGATLFAGSRLRVELTGSAFSLFTRHPNGIRGGAHTADDGKLNIATVALRSAGEEISWIEIPLAAG